jgi:hypothetical protein
VARGLAEQWLWMACCNRRQKGRQCPNIHWHSFSGRVLYDPVPGRIKSRHRKSADSFLYADLCIPASQSKFLKRHEQVAGFLNRR